MAVFPTSVITPGAIQQKLHEAALPSPGVLTACSAKNLSSHRFPGSLKNLKIATPCVIQAGIVLPRPRPAGPLSNDPKQDPGRQNLVPHRALMHLVHTPGIPRP